jgi:IS605 OrfB family transposase
MNKMHGQMAKQLSRCTKGSRRWKKLRKARATQASRIERRVRDVRHKATRQVIDFCMAHEVGKVFVGNPDGVRRNRCGRKHNQRMSQWEYGKDIIDILPALKNGDSYGAVVHVAVNCSRFGGFLLQHFRFEGSSNGRDKA